MLFSTAVVALFGLSATVIASSSSAKAKPECVDKCWTNSQYVSLCMGDHQCLCDDTEFQNAVYQCLYSQCSTSKFGTALHHALQACHTQEQHETPEDVFNVMPIDTDEQYIHGLRNAKRYMSGSASVSATRSATKSVSASVTPTRSVSRSVSVSVTRSVTRSKSVGMGPNTTRTLPGGNPTTTSGGVGPTSKPATKSVTKTLTKTLSVSATKSVYPTRSVTKSVTKSATKSATKSVTKSVYPTRSVTRSVTKSVQPTRSVTKSVSSSAKPTRSVTKSATSSARPTRSVTRSVTSSASPTRSVSRSASASATISAVPRARRA